MINKKHYEKKRTVTDYSLSKLQNPEVIILVKYSSNITEKHILDIGCGAGRTTFNLKNMSKHYVGLDYSYDMIETCKKRFKDVNFIHGDVIDMSAFEDESFDFILFSYNGLDSIDHDDRLKGLREIHRVLKNDGIFAFSSHNINYKDAVSPPKLTFTLCPFVQARYLVKFIKSTHNHSTNKKKQHFGKEYSIINDKAHNFGLLTYYIDKKNQMSQLERTGFRTMEMYDTNGNNLNPDSDDKDSAWIYYVAEKVQ